MKIEQSELGGSDRFTVNGEMEVSVDVFEGCVRITDAFDADGDLIYLSNCARLTIEVAIEEFFKKNY